MSNERARLVHRLLHKVYLVTGEGTVYEVELALMFHVLVTLAKKIK